MSTSLTVCIRIHPDSAPRSIIDPVDTQLLVFDPLELNPLTLLQQRAFPNLSMRSREYRFMFDRVFPGRAQTPEVYSATAQPLLDGLLDGFNATVFAYGATGCGKTHTINGTAEAPGLTRLTTSDLFLRIAALEEDIVDVQLLYLEIYNETIRDLLRPDTPSQTLTIREDAKSKITVANLLTHAVLTPEEVMQLVDMGNVNRASSPTAANAASSRLHAVLQLQLLRRPRVSDVSECHSSLILSIIDLAGSERAQATHNRGARLAEGANINRLLLALGNCINALCDTSRRRHIPYRDSKLTRLLKFSLGGNCRTVMVVCVLPLSRHYDETLNTLQYANRAKQIKTSVHQNQHALDRHVGSYLKMIAQQRAEIERLRKRLVSGGEEAVGVLAAAMASLKSSLDAQTLAKHNKAHVLALRRVLITQRTTVDELVSLAKGRQLPEWGDALVATESLRSTICERIAHCEHQWLRETSIDRLLGPHARQILAECAEHPGWSQKHTAMFEQAAGWLRDALERDVLFQLLVIFDQMVGTSPMGFVSRLLVEGVGERYVAEVRRVQQEMSGWGALQEPEPEPENDDPDVSMEEAWTASPPGKRRSLAKTRLGVARRLVSTGGAVLDTKGAVKQ